MLDVLLRDTAIGMMLKMQKAFNFNDALKYVNELPYGRNKNSEITCILVEKQGTCSTKHAFLAFLAHENNLPIKLMLGYYKMNQANTPKIGSTLENYGLPFVLEAHCYLKYYDTILDVTFPGSIKNKLDFDIIDEQEISPHELYKKPENHKQKLKEWIRGNPNYPLQDIDKLWQARENCIQAASSRESVI